MNYHHPSQLAIRCHIPVCCMPASGCLGSGSLPCRAHLSTDPPAATTRLHRGSLGSSWSLRVGHLPGTPLPPLAHPWPPWPPGPPAPRPPRRCSSTRWTGAGRRHRPRTPPLPAASLATLAVLWEGRPGAPVAPSLPTALHNQGPQPDTVASASLGWIHIGLLEP